MLYKLGCACFGAAIGLIARLLLPGHHVGSTLLVPTLSIAGALAAFQLGEQLGLTPARNATGIMLASLGAIASLLIYGLAFYELGL